MYCARVGVKHIKVNDDLYDYLKNRAARNFRHPAAELHAILHQLRKEEDQLRKEEEAVALLPLRSQQDEQHEQQDEATQALLAGRRGPLSTVSGYHGVYPYGKRWQARITRGGQMVRIGVYDDLEEAAQAFDDTIRRCNLPIGSLNFPNEVEKQILHNKQEVDSVGSAGVEHQRVDDEHWKVITQPAYLELNPASLPPALRRGLIAAGDTTVPDVEDAFEEPPPDPDVDPD